LKREKGRGEGGGETQKAVLLGFTPEQPTSSASIERNRLRSTGHLL
jgi:hypothetical protein